MTSYTSVQRYTPAVLRAVCQSRGLTPGELRLGTLKRVGVELANLLDPGVADLHPDLREALDDLRHQVRLAVGDE